MLNQRAAACLLCLSLLFAAPANAQEGPHGLWKGAIAGTQRNYDIEIVLRLSEDGTWSGDIAIPQRGVRGLALIGVEIGEQSIRFGIEVPGDPTFTGTWDLQAGRISGDFEQSGQLLSFHLERVGDAPEPVEVEPFDAEVAAKVVGDWEGTAQVEGMSIRWIFHIAMDGESLSATIDAPDRGRFGMQLVNPRFDGATFRVALPLNGGTLFTGTMSDDGTKLDGALSGGVETDLTLTKR